MADRTVPRETPDPIAVALAYAVRRAVAAKAERRATMMTVVEGRKGGAAA